MSLGLVVAVLMSGAGDSSKVANEKVFVVPVKGEGVKADVLSAVSDMVAVAVSRSSKMRVVTIEDVNSMLDQERRKDAMGCDSVSCAVELGGALGVRYLLSTRVKRLGGDLIFTASLIDTAEQASKNGQGRCKDDTSLYEGAIASAVAEAMGQVAGQQSETAAAVEADIQQPGSTLRWSACPVGQTKRDRCDGVPSQYSWDDAQKACPDGYRVPTLDEFKILLGCSAVLKDRCNACRESASCSAVFGDANGYFWTSSASETDDAWVVGLRSGSAARISKTATRYVRCIRGASNANVP